MSIKQRWTWIDEDHKPPFDSKCLYTVITDYGDEEVEAGLAYETDEDWIVITHRKNYRSSQVLAFMPYPHPYGYVDHLYEEEEV